MDTQDVWSVLKEIPIGTIVAYIMVGVAIIAAIVAGLKKLHTVFEKTYKLKEENLSVKDMVMDHDELLKKMDKQLDDIQFTIQKVEEHDQKFTDVEDSLQDIKNTLDKQNQDSLRKMRHGIVRAGEEALARGTMTIREYRSLCELYDRYHADGNGYVTSLMKKIDKHVKITGKLNDEGEDIQEDDE